MVSAAGGTILYWLFRPNRANVDPDLELEVWPVVTDGGHNSYTDLIFWQNHYFLVHSRAPFHTGSIHSRLLVWRSSDARTWTNIATLTVPDEDIRDPKFALINGLLHLYALKNHNLEPEPYTTIVATSADGETWSEFHEVTPAGWLFWRPKTRDGVIWYAPAYWHEHGRSMLFQSTDGLHWSAVSLIHEGDRNDETALAFLPEERMLVTGRLEGHRKWHQGAHDAGTLLAVADPPYTRWRKTRSDLARLDGPVLFTCQDRVYAVARYEPAGAPSFLGRYSTFSRKRTSLYEIKPDRLIWLTDLPSAGDTSYPGVVLKDGQLWISYYTSHTGRDYPWLLGLFLPTRIFLARLPLRQLVALAES